ncbi:serine protease [Kitasatospora sp. NPDC052896]|uniref:serine protease n=1 Tax=Kitasatospora sp. NPDC052896 TaxID=3364061 RepID=UPI0037CB9936
MAGGLADGAAEGSWRSLLRIRGLDGRPRGYGIAADPDGTVLTGYEVVADGRGLLLETAGGECRELPAERVTALPEHGLALLDAGGPVGPPLVLGPYRAGQPVLLLRPDEPPESSFAFLAQQGPTGAVLAGALLGTGSALLPGPGRPLLLEGTLLFDLPEAVAGPMATASAGLPVLDAECGAVLGLLAPGLRGVAPGVPAAVPVQPTGAAGPLAALLARNAATVPGYGRALNLGGVLELASRQLAGAAAGPARIADLAADRVDRLDGLAGEEPRAELTVLVGEPGSGRSTELAALAVRRADGPRPLPTLWLRGADLRAGDRSPAEAVGRALARAEAGIPGARATGGEALAEAVARVAATAGRPLLVVLDGPEEAPAAFGPAWHRETARWLRALGVRLLLACRPETWEQYADGVEAGSVQLHRLGPLSGEAAERVARRYGVPPPTGPVDPLALRWAGELRAAGVDRPAPDRSALCSATLDLACLRIGRRIAETAAAQPGRPGTHRRGGQTRPAAPPSPGQLRRLAAVVAGRVHEAARRMLGPGQGGLGRAAFEELFPPDTGWARAVLAEELFVPAGDGYRLAHEELADWLQGLHLDLDGALRLLLDEDEGRSGVPAGPPGRTVPRHRLGAVAAALRTIGGTRGPVALDLWLHRLLRALESSPPGGEPHWWAARLLAVSLRAVPDPAVHRALLDRLAARLAESAGQPAAGPDPFGPVFWAALPLQPPDRLDLLRSLVRADGPEQGFLTAAAGLLRADPPTVLPLLCRWFDDGRLLPGRPGASVADLAQDLLHAHRALAVDELTEALVEAAHPRADALLTVLAVEEPSALCRAVDRWSHDRRPERHVAAAVHALRAAPYATGAGRELLRHAAAALLAREDEPGLHGAALALLVRDPGTRAARLPAALAAYRADDPFVTPDVLAPALDGHQEAVLAAFEARLAEPGGGVAAVLRVLAVAPPAGVGRPVPDGLPDPATRLAGRLLRDRPERAELVAEYLGQRLVRGTAARGDLTALLGPRPADRPAPVRRAFALVLAAPGPADPLREELLDRLLAAEPDPAVLGPVLERLALTCAAHRPDRLRAVVRRIADSWDRARAAALDAALVRCAGRSAGFALLLAEWPADARPPVGGPLLARMRILVAEGRDPQFAAAEAERAPVRTAPVPAPAASAGVPVPGLGRAHGTL